MIRFLQQDPLKDREHNFSSEDVGKLKSQEITDPTSFWKKIGDDVDNGIVQLSESTKIPIESIVCYLREQVQWENAHLKGHFQASNPFGAFVFVAVILLLLLGLRFVFQGVPLHLGSFSAAAVVAGSDIAQYAALEDADTAASSAILFPIPAMATSPSEVLGRYSLSPIKKGAVITKTSLSEPYPAGEKRRVLTVPVQPNQLMAVPPGKWATLLLSPKTAAEGAGYEKVDALVLGYNAAQNGLPPSAVISISEKDIDRIGLLLGTSEVYLASP